MTNLMGHHEADRIASDLELSERLGAELLAAGCQPILNAVSEPARPWRQIELETKSNLLTGESRTCWVEVL